MTTVILALGAVVAVAAAVRSTWSPCGLSMLSTITPFGERGRGHRYAATATWFIVGAVIGGVTLGGLAAGLAAAANAGGISAHPGWIALIVAFTAGVGAAIDAGVFGPVIPIWRRQVDDRWLVRYRSWVYGAGFGWQIGVGIATYIMTAAVFLVVVLAAMTADPFAAVAICALFGLARGLAVLSTARADSPAQLRALHRRFDRYGPAVRVSLIAVQVAVLLAVLTLQWLLGGALAGLAVAALVSVVAVTAGRASRLSRASRAAVP